MAANPAAGPFFAAFREILPQLVDFFLRITVYEEGYGRSESERMFKFLIVI